MPNEIVRGKCPACKHKYNPLKAEVAFIEDVKDRSVQLVFALCPDCKWCFDLATANERISFANSCFENVKLSEDPLAFTITSSLALEAHKGAFYPAWFFGLDIPRPLFDAIYSGTVNECQVLSDIDLQMMKRVAVRQQSK